MPRNVPASRSTVTTSRSIAPTLGPRSGDLGQGGRIDHADRLAGHPRFEILEAIAVEVLVDISADVAEVWHQHDVVHAAQRMIRRQRLAVVDVEPGAGDAALPERIEQGGLVDDRAARGVDQ